MPISVNKLKDSASEKGYKYDSQTIKIPDNSHRFGAEQRNQSLEINYSNHTKEWIGFSYNTDSKEKLDYAKSEKSYIELVLQSIKKRDGSSHQLMHLENDKTYASKGTPGQKNSYIFYSIKCPASPSNALAILEELFEASRTK
tara:strand:- start:48 stop:476 length:429 start_codon:yes stop_codon:yes gene_type:complete